jgi:2-polyprenyl-3-methyl-5-hydroxy-6-metoxy-1,4-benzoquinol methylase
MVEIPCCLCGSADNEPLLTSEDYVTGEVFRVVRCVGCGLSYVNPRPVATELGRYYPQTHQGSAPAAYERADARPRVKFVSALLGGPPGRILDVGCGKGLLLAGLRATGWEVAGTELSEVSSRFATAAGIAVHHAPVEECSFEAGSFDVVTLYHSLEHMTDPMRTLTAVHRLVRPGGFLVVEVPNFGSWYAKAFGDAWFHLDVPRHLFHFTQQTLQHLVETAGFRVVRQETRNLQYDAFGGVQSALNKILRKKNLLNNFNTGEVTLTELWRGVGRFRNLTAMAISEMALVVGFPLLALASVALAPWANGGTLRFVATRNEPG